MAEVEALLENVVARLAGTVSPAGQADKGRLEFLCAGTPYQPAEDDQSHQAALDPRLCAAASGGSLYPDHVIFLGEGMHRLRAGETVGAWMARIGESAPNTVLVEGAGMVVRREASAGAKALARCLSDVLRRVPEGAPLTYLTAQQNHELLNWDAEKYRQTLNTNRDNAADAQIARHRT